MPPMYTPHWQVKQRLREVEESLFIAWLLHRVADDVERKAKTRRPKARKAKRRTRA